MTMRAVLAIAIALLATSFALQNAAPVAVTFVIWRFESSLALVLVFTLMLGASITAVLGAPGALRRTRERAELGRRTEDLHRRVAELERELAAARGARPEPSH